MNNEELIKVLMDIPEKEFTKLIYQVERQRELRDRWENIEKQRKLQY